MIYSLDVFLSLHNGKWSFFTKNNNNHWRKWRIKYETQTLTVVPFYIHKAFFPSLIVSLALRPLLSRSVELTLISKEFPLRSPWIRFRGGDRVLFHPGSKWKSWMRLDWASGPRAQLHGIITNSKGLTKYSWISEPYDSKV